MAWSTSSRRDELPADWDRIRKRIMRRDSGACQWRAEDGLCLSPANQVDHIRPGGDHSEGNLQALCQYHHAKKSAGEGHQAQRAARRATALRFRRTEGHPGLL